MSYHRTHAIDATQQAIVDALRAVGATVMSLSAVGRGVPDLLVGHRGRTLLVECKGKDGKLRPSQQTFRHLWRGGAVATVYNARQAVDLLTQIAQIETEASATQTVRRVLDKPKGGPHGGQVD